MTSTSDRFWGSAAREGECLVWQRRRFWNGYGRFRLGGKTRIASRVAWELTRGPIPEGLQVLHRCDNPPCVNPEHLFLGTHHDNMADMVSKGRQAHGEAAAGAQLTRADVETARAMRTAGRTYDEVARHFGVSHGCAYAALNGITWKLLADTKALPRRVPSAAHRSVVDLFADGRGRSTAEVRKALGINKATALYRLKHCPGIQHIRAGLWAPTGTEGGR